MPSHCAADVASVIARLDPTADCTVTISKRDGAESSRTITGVSPHVLDGDYKLAVSGETPTSRWRKDTNGWTSLA
jgi:hypothetical protein